MLALAECDIMLFAEGIAYHQEVGTFIRQSPNLFNYTQLPKDYQEGISQINAEDYQAILPKPFYNVGSENTTITGQYESMRASMAFSYHLGPSDHGQSFVEEFHFTVKEADPIDESQLWG